jgi:hypothetical protein
MRTHEHLEAQRDVLAILESRGSDVISWEGRRGPGETDLEAYWETGDKWLLQVWTDGGEDESADGLGKLSLRARCMGAIPAVARVDGMRIEFRSIPDQTLLEIPEV